MRLLLPGIVLVFWLQAATAANEYIDARTCATCHQKIDAAYRQTGMGRSLFKPAPANTVEDYRNRHEFEHAASSTHYSMSVRDGSYYQRRWQIGFDGKETNVEEMKIDLVIGRVIMRVRICTARSTADISNCRWAGMRKRADIGP